MQQELTLRQSEILLLVSKGLSYKEVAQELYISLNTVRTHMELIQERLGTDNKAHSVAEGIRRNLIH